MDTISKRIIVVAVVFSLAVGLMVYGAHAGIGKADGVVKAVRVDETTWEADFGFGNGTKRFKYVEVDGHEYLCSFAGGLAHSPKCHCHNAFPQFHRPVTPIQRPLTPEPDDYAATGL